MEYQCSLPPVLLSIALYPKAEKDPRTRPPNGFSPLPLFRRNKPRQNPAARLSRLDLKTIQTLVPGLNLDQPRLYQFYLSPRWVSAPVPVIFSARTLFAASALPARPLLKVRSQSNAKRAPLRSRNRRAQACPRC